MAAPGPPSEPPTQSRAEEETLCKVTSMLCVWGGNPLPPPILATNTVQAAEEATQNSELWVQMSFPYVCLPLWKEYKSRE